MCIFICLFIYLFIYSNFVLKILKFSHDPSEARSSGEEALLTAESRWVGVMKWLIQCWWHQSGFIV